jgi:hypothetical protein
LKAYQPSPRQGHGEADGGAGTLNQYRHDSSGEHGQNRVRAEIGEEVSHRGAGPKGFHHVAHHGHAQQQQTEPHDRTSPQFPGPVFPQETGAEAQGDHGKGVVGDLEGYELAGDRGSYVRPEDDSHSLLKGHQGAVDESHRYGPFVAPEA